jgi:hypothetical protein
MSLSVAQRAELKTRGHWSWSIELAGPAEELDQVEWVEYTLHPTFSPPVHRVEDRASSFRLDGSGWGEFMVHIAIRRRDGTTETVQHWLELDGQSPRPAVPAAAPSPGAAPREAPRRVGLTGTAPPAAPVLKSAPGESTGEGRMVYISAGLADRYAAAKLTKVLRGADVEVWTGGEVATPEDSPDAMIQRALQSVDGAIFVISERESPWVRHELSAARALQLPVAIVKAGTTRPVPSELVSVASMTADVPDRDIPDDDMRPVAAWAAGLPIRNRRPGSVR